MKLNTAQQTAVLRDLPAYAVLASAGAGKTRVLVEKYLHHVVDQGYSPDEVLTITFTRKAAAEMKARIVKRLRELDRLEDAQKAETGPISTIHGLCERLLRENALAAQVDPRFEVIRDPQTDLLFNEALQETLATDLAATPMVEKLLTRLSGKASFRHGPILEQQLKDSIFDVVENLRTSGISLDTLDKHYESPESLQAYAIHQFAKRNPTLNAILNSGLEGTDAIQALKKTKKADRGDAQIWLDFKIDPWVETVTYEESWATVRLALDVWTRYESRLREAQQLDFNLLESKAVHLITEIPDVKIRIRNQYKALLVDETQDVNPVQFRLLDELKLEHQMMVGDPQQSIYYFRGANPDLFAQRAHGEGTVNLVTNYRSTPQIIDFINDFFHRLWPGKYNQMEPHEEAPKPKSTERFKGVELWEVGAFDSEATALGIKDLLDQGTEPGKIAVLVDYSSRAIDMADALAAHNIASEIHGGSRRFYVRMETRDLANALTACADPHDDYALTALLMSPYVGLTLDSIVLIGHESPIYDRLSTITLEDENQQNKLTRFLEWFPQLAHIADRVPAWELVSELLHQTDYFHNIVKRPGGQQTFANVRKLLSLASQQTELKAQEYASLIRQIPDFRHRESEAATFDQKDKAVNIMTIHSAKGLEFPTVVLPDLFNAIANHMQGTPYIDRNTGLVALSHPRGKSSLSQWINMHEKDSLTEEKLRLLYVAMTRAEQRLCLAIPTTPQRRNNLAKIVSETLGYPDSVHPSIKIRPQPTHPQDIEPTPVD